MTWSIGNVAVDKKARIGLIETYIRAVQIRANCYWDTRLNRLEMSRLKKMPHRQNNSF